MVAQKIPWFLVTEKEIDSVIVSNIEWLYGVKGYFTEVITDDLLLTFEYISAYFVQHTERKLVDLCKAFDRAYQQELGQLLYDICLICAARLVTFDM